jgi:PleD family two-component response regulator
VIVITSSESLEIRQRYFDLGVTDFVLKKDLNYDSFNRYLERFSREDPLKERLRTLSIAVLEDNRMEMNIIRNIFALNGIDHVDYYDHPRALLESTVNHDIFICDVVLPEMRGEDVVRILRKKNPKAAILVISALSKYKAIAPVLDAGAQDYIAKPFLPDVFMLRLRSAVKDLMVLDLLQKHGIDPRDLF